MARTQKRARDEGPPSKKPKMAPQFRDKARISEDAGPELKYFDTVHSFLFDATGEIPATGQLNLIPQGDDASSRDGYKCVLKSIRMTGNVQFTPTATTSSGTGFGRLALVLDTQCNGAAAAVTDVFVENNMARTLPRVENAKRFKILKEWRMNFNTGAGSTTQYASVSRPFKYYRRVEIPLTFIGETGAITELRSNNLFLIAGANATADDEITFVGTTRVRFSDS